MILPLQIGHQSADFVGVMPLLRWLQAQTGQSTVGFGLILGTGVCMIWTLLLATGTDPGPGVSAMTQALEPIRQRISDLIAP